MSIETTIAQIYEARLLTSFEEVNRFDNYLASLENKDIEKHHFVELMKVFDDKTKQFDVMWGLIHFLERKNVEYYYQAFIDSLDFLMQNAFQWARIIIARIMNSPKVLNGALLYVKKSDKSESFRQLLTIVYKENGKLSNLAYNLLSQV